MWLIVDISENHSTGYGWPADAGIPLRRRPSHVHGTLERAENEALRLAKRFPHGEFVIFEAVATARKTMSDKSVFRLEPVLK